MALIDALDIGALAEEEARKLGLSPKLYRKVVLDGENSELQKIDTEATNKATGAKGVAQVTESTWKGLIKNGKIPADSDIFDARTNLRAGAMVLKEQLAMAGGNEAAAVAGYNAGNEVNRAVQRGEMPPAKETQAYLQRVGLGPQSPWLQDSDPNTPTGLVLARASSGTVTPEQKSALSVEQAKLLESNRAATEQFKQALLGTSTDYATASQATAKSGDAAADIANLQGGIDVAKLLHKQVVNRVFNLSVNDPDSIVIASQKKRAEAQTKMDMLRPVIDAEDNVKLWDDPLRWVANQFTLPTLKHEFNQAVRSKVSATRYIAETQALAKEQQELDPAMVVDDITKMAAAKAAGLRFTALADASKLHAESNTAIARSIQADMVFNNQSFEQRMEVAKLHQTSLNYERATAAEVKQNALEKRLQGTVDAASTKLNSMGMPSINFADFQLMDKNRAARLTDFAKLKTYGDGPGDTLANVREFANTQKFLETNITEARLITSLVRNHEYAVIESKQKDNPNFLKLAAPQQREYILQELFDEQVTAATAATADNSKLPASNPYKLVHANVVGIQGLANNTFAKELPTLAETSPTKVVDDKAMLHLFLGKVGAEPGRVKQLSEELAAYYTKATENQWAKGGAMMIGYPRFQRYGVTDPKTGKAINAMSALELETFAARHLSAQLHAQQYLESVWGWPGEMAANTQLQQDEPLQ